MGERATRGEIEDAADLDRLDTFLRDHASPPPEVTVDDDAGVTTLRAPADVFVRLVKLAHH